MLKIGLTGNIGSGKTWVCKVFEALGVPIYYADLEARKILNSQNMIQEIIETFGHEVALNKNEINRKALAAIVFNDKAELDKLNQLIHPKLREDFLEWSNNYKTHPYVMQEAAILFENGFHTLMDKNITVSAPQEIRLKRVMERDEANEDEVLARMRNQWLDKKKEKAADFIIYNDGQQMVLAQILKIHQNILK